MVQARHGTEKVWLHGNYSVGDRQFARQEIEKITAARAWEIFEVVRKKLGVAWMPESCLAGVVLTGGGAKLSALTECAKGVFGTQFRLGEVSKAVHEDLRDPGYHTVLGVLHFGASAHQASSGRRAGGALRLWRRLFPGKPGPG